MIDFDYLPINGNWNIKSKIVASNKLYIVLANYITKIKIRLKIGLELQTMRITYQNPIKKSLEVNNDTSNA